LLLILGLEVVLHQQSGGCFLPEAELYVYLSELRLLVVGWDLESELIALFIYLLGLK
jgi:hypothetical protein